MIEALAAGAGARRRRSVRGAAALGLDGGCGRRRSVRAADPTAPVGSAVRTDNLAAGNRAGTMDKARPRTPSLVRTRIEAADSSGVQGRCTAGTVRGGLHGRSLLSFHPVRFF